MRITLAIALLAGVYAVAVLNAQTTTTLEGVYACGVILWEMLTGREAFPAPTHGDGHQRTIQVMTRKQGHPPLDPGEAFPEALRDLVIGLCASAANFARR